MWPPIPTSRTCSTSTAAPSTPASPRRAAPTRTRWSGAVPRSEQRPSRVVGGDELAGVAGPVGDDRVDAELEAAQDVVRFVDRVDVHLVPALVRTPDLLRPGPDRRDRVAGDAAAGREPTVAKADRHP